MFTTDTSSQYRSLSSLPPSPSPNSPIKSPAALLSALLNPRTFLVISALFVSGLFTGQLLSSHSTSERMQYRDHALQALQAASAAAASYNTKYSEGINSMHEALSNDFPSFYVQPKQQQEQQERTFESNQAQFTKQETLPLNQNVYEKVNSNVNGQKQHIVVPPPLPLNGNVNEKLNYNVNEQRQHMFAPAAQPIVQQKEQPSIPQQQQLHAVNVNQQNNIQQEQAIISPVPQLPQPEQQHVRPVHVPIQYSAPVSTISPVVSTLSPSSPSYNMDLAARFLVRLGLDLSASGKLFFSSNEEKATLPYCFAHSLAPGLATLCPQFYAGAGVRACNAGTGYTCMAHAGQETAESQEEKTRMGVNVMKQGIEGGGACGTEFAPVCCQVEENIHAVQNYCACKRVGGVYRAPGSVCDSVKPLELK